MRSRTDSSDYSKQVVNDIRTLSAEEVLSLHGIEVREDKTVYDQAYDMTFTTIEDWVAFSSEDEDNEFEKFSNGHHDEYF